MTCDYCRREATVFYIVSGTSRQYCRRHAKLSDAPWIKRFTSEEDRTLYRLKEAL